MHQGVFELYRHFSPRLGYTKPNLGPTQLGYHQPWGTSRTDVMSANPTTRLFLVRVQIERCSNAAKQRWVISVVVVVIVSKGRKVFSFEERGW